MKLQSNVLWKLVVVCGVFLLAVGCSSADSAEKDKDRETAETVVKKMFSGPNEELAENYENIQQSASEIESYYDEEFKPYFSENYYDDVIANRTVNLFHSKVQGINGKMNVEDLTIEPVESAENAYTYTVKVQITKVEEENETVELSGRINFNEDGAITRITHKDLDTFTKAVSAKE
ncbi:hypothetical protein N780_04085 [Pontibacillus chungwhensis BH030062]|uniref:Lipoprotein n=1 Tax=Pontibacillus chungwhensis BH030062 TaxID=1385513 RepID=A0A0A2UV56_9BACI|nr:hypothetical protein [Pontibacillus chungwhensis]KGP90658.1 hypothetical protein N780_04085 [Pontibacillus chungwhensis BH030062]